LNVDRNPLDPPLPMASDPTRPPFPPDAALLETIDGGSSDARRELAEGRAHLVVTGQQPCFPLPLGLTLQKIATAIALAARLREEWSAPVHPLFWNGADDSDFEEARGIELGRAQASPIGVSLSASQSRKGAFVGDLSPEAAFQELGELQFAAERLYRFAPLEGEDLGRQQGRILREFFAPWGLMVLDARSEALRLAARGLFMTYAERREEFAAKLDVAGDSIEKHLSTRPLRPGLGERALFFLRRRRRVLPSLEDYGRELETRLNARPAELSPNAALRPLVQDRVLPVAATVLGPSEWNYHLQLRELFPLLEVAFPKPCPRLTAAWEGDLKRGLVDEGRRSSPLARDDHPLADPELLVELAGEHLENWRRGEWTRFQLPEDPRGN